MNIINKVTVRHLKENKRRSLVTIIGVIISVAMITAVATLGVSFLDLMIRDEISRNGEWHVQYKNVTLDDIEAIAKDQNTKTVTLTSDSYAAFEQSENERKPYLYFKNYSKDGMKQFPIKIKEGRLPENSNEIAISEAILKNAKVNYKIGDQLTFDMGERISNENGMPLTQVDPIVRNEEGAFNETLDIKETKTVTIVGIIERPNWEPAWSPGYTVIGFIDEKSISKADTVNAVVVLKEIKTSIFDDAKGFPSAQGNVIVSFNSDLLRFYGVTDNDNLRTTLFSLVGIIMGIIIVGSVALIYNAFAISVSERARHLGMLSSVGATKKQKRNSVFFEGAIIGAISIPIGVIAGIAGIGITFAFINKYLQGALGVSENLQVVVTPSSIIVACGVSILTIFISTYIPARKASKISAIDAIRQTNDIKLSRKKVKTSKLVRKVFGIEAELGLKNMKRNKKRYLATVFSLVISIVLFLSVNYFTVNLKKSAEMSLDKTDYDIQIYSSTPLNREELEEFTRLDYVTESTIIQEAQIEALIDLEQIPEQLKTVLHVNDSTLLDGKYQYYVTVNSLDDESFKEYAEEIGVDANNFMNASIPTAIVIDKISYQDFEEGRIIETTTIESKVGDTIDLYSFDYTDMENDEPKRNLISNVQIGALTDQVPMGVQRASLGGINVIVSEETMSRLGINKQDIYSYVYLNSSDPMATQEAIEKNYDTNVYVYNVYEQRQRQNQMILLMSVFTYGFITLISLISIANIFNTISTSIALRKREFAMLRSVGMTPKGFNKMINYESIFYGVKALTYGLPISILAMFGMHKSIQNTFEYGFSLPWMSILFVIVVIFLIVGSAMLYSISKIKNENIIDSLKQENI